MKAEEKVKSYIEKAQRLCPHAGEGRCLDGGHVIPIAKMLQEEDMRFDKAILSL